MPLIRYLPHEDIKLLQREIKYQIENPLILTPRWILHPDRLYIEIQLNNKKDAEIVLTLGTKNETDRLVKNRLNFKNIRKLVLYF